MGYREYLDKATSFPIAQLREERLFRRTELNGWKPALRGALKGTGAAIAVAEFDRGLQWIFGHKIFGHDVFAPTPEEEAAASFAANFSGNGWLRIGVAGSSWIIARGQNFVKK